MATTEFSKPVDDEIAALNNNIFAFERANYWQVGGFNYISSGSSLTILKNRNYDRAVAFVAVYTSGSGHPYDLAWSGFVAINPTEVRLTTLYGTAPSSTTFYFTADSNGNLVFTAVNVNYHLKGLWMY